MHLLSLMTKFLNFLAILLLLMSSLSWAQDASYEALLPLFESGRELGEVKASIVNESIEWLDQDTLLSALGSRVNSETLFQIKSLPSKIHTEELPFEVSLDVENLVLRSTLALSNQGREKLRLREEFQDIQESSALKPSPFGGAINTRLEQSWGDERLGPKGLGGQFNSFFNLNTYVFENQSFYQSGAQNEWYRGDTRIVKDFEQQEIRTQIGDIYPLIQGFMAPRPMGGINIQRNFSLNPYRLPYPTGTQDFTIKSRSLVKYFVNGVLIKTEYLSAGNYSATDIPLNNGLNTIVIEATDELGQKQIFTFRSTTSINLLNKGESRFDLSYGTPFIDSAQKRSYLYDEGEVFSGFYQYGLTPEVSASAYLQNQQDLNLLGSEVLTATVLGNFSFGHARSFSSRESGHAESLGYQLVSQGKHWYHSHSLGLRYEGRSEDFQTTPFDITGVVKNNYGINYAIPIANVMTVSVGGNYGDVRNNALADRYGFDTTLNIRLYRHHNLSFFISRNRDERKNWNNVGYVFLTINFPETNDFVSALHDHEQKSTRLTYLRDNQGRLYEPRTQATIEHGEGSQSGEVDILMPTQYGDIGGRVAGRSLTHEEEGFTRGSLRVHSALVFAYEDGRWGYGLSRPVPGSFVIFKPEDQLSNQTIGLKSTSPYTEAQSGLFDEITFSNLLAYQYRDVQLDPTMLEEGRSLVREKFLLYPTYRSAHLITLEERGSVTLRGQLLYADGRAVTLQVGQIGGVTFFTNRDGHFYIEGLEPGEYLLTLDDKESKTKIEVNRERRGLINLGQVFLEESL